MYQGILLSDKITNGRKAGEISVSASEVSFTRDELEIRFPIKGLEIEHGGAANRLLYLKHPHFKDYVIQLADFSILKNQHLAFLNTTQDTLDSIKKHRFSFIGLLTATISLIVVAVVLFYVFRNKIIEHIAYQVPISYQESIGKPVFESTLAANKVLDDDSTTRFIQEISKPLLANVSDTSIKFVFKVVENDQVNAFALPGGYVVIYSGLLQKADSPDEVAGVLAHEISHVTKRHHIRGIFNKVGSFYVIGMFLGDLSIVGHILDVASLLESLNFSRDFETEADKEGLKLAMKAGYSAEGFASFFKKLQEKNKLDSDMMKYISTHPNSEDRIETILKESKNIQKAEKSPEFFIDYARFKKHLNKLLQ